VETGCNTGLPFFSNPVGNNDIFPPSRLVLMSNKQSHANLISHKIITLLNPVLFSGAKREGKYWKTGVQMFQEAF
jgi:hypothetical protein